MKTAIVLGTFDGLHAGHRAVIEKAAGFFSVAVTFDIPPKSALNFEPQLLMSSKERTKRIKELGIDRVEMQNFNDVKNIEAIDYLEILKKKYSPDRIVCGFNYKFGKNAIGNTDLLDVFCKEHKIELIVVPPVQQNGTVLSSTNIRRLIQNGNIKEASSQIYGGFSFTAEVVHGDARGRELGFPTANQVYPTDMVRVKFGVYISRVTVDDKQYKAITNIGIRPTFKTDIIGCETFIKDFSEEIYGKEMKTELLEFVREEQKFSSIDALKKAILKDVELLN